MNLTLLRILTPSGATVDDLNTENLSAKEVAVALSVSRRGWADILVDRSRWHEYDSVADIENQTLTLLVSDYSLKDAFHLFDLLKGSANVSRIPYSTEGYLDDFDVDHFKEQAVQDIYNALVARNGRFGVIATGRILLMHRSLALHKTRVREAVVLAATTARNRNEAIDFLEEWQRDGDLKVHPKHLTRIPPGRAR